MKPSETKAERLIQIEALLLSHPEGLTQSEIAKKMQVNRSTILRNLQNLQAPVYQDGQRYFIDREAYFVNVRFSLHEALSIHLAARLLTTRLERQNPHAAAALRKLGLALESLAPCISSHLKLSADDIDDASRHSDAVYLAALEKLTLAWAEQRKIQIWYRADKKKETSIHLYHPYYIEPYAIGQSTYVFGYSETAKENRTLKIERIQRVELLRESYIIPDDFSLAKLLENAWGIWYSDKAPVEVVLKFSPEVRGRVEETRWHRSEQVHAQPDGSLLWHAWIAEPQEMVSWIKGWGSEVEVLEPLELRKTFMDEALRVANLYHPGLVSLSGEK